MKRQFFVILLLLIVVSCGEKSINQNIFDLAYIQLCNGKYEECENLINQAENLTAQDSICKLLLQYSVYVANTNFGMLTDSTTINKAIDYFDDNNEKLAWALLCKSASLFGKLEWNKGILPLKKAEHLSKELGNKELDFQIAFLMLNYDLESDNYAFKRGYIDKMEQNISNNRETTLVYFLRAESLKDINEDSARHYIKKAVALTEDNFSVSTYFAYCLYAELFSGQNDTLAEFYANKALTMNPASDNANYALGRIHLLKYDDIATAETFFNKIENHNFYHLCKAKKSLFNYCKEKSNFKKTCDLAQDVIMLNDSILKENQNNEIPILRLDYDYKIENLKQKNRFERVVFLIVISAIFLIVALIIFMIIQKQKHKSKLLENSLILKGLQDKIQDLKNADKTADNLKEIARLKNRIAEIEEKYSEIYSEGKRYYDELFQQDGSASQWDKREYEKFLEYYKNLNISQIVQLEDEYINLTPRQKLFKILQFNGFEKPQLMQKNGFLRGCQF